MRKIILRSFATLLLVIVFTTSLLSVGAQQGGTTTYVYDDNGRLHAVIAPNGEAAVYEYDAAGNITAITRIAADSLSILSFSPHEGLPGDQVVFTGTGFGGGVTNVSFNGASATIVSTTPSRVVATVPPAATTGLVTITTPTGSVSTATPFTIAGLRITPTFAAVYFGGSVQFSAEVLPSTIDQNVVWTVEDVVGGNNSVGTISSSGVYTAPNIRYSSLTIRATSVTDNTRFATAQVKVSDPNDVQSVLAAAVSVSRGENAGAAAYASQVAVQYGFSGDSQAAFAQPIAIQYGTLSTTQSALSKSISIQYDNLRGASAAFSPPLSVQRGTSTQSTAIANQVSIKYQSSLGQYSAADAVSATRGPTIQSLSPGNLNRGAAVTLTVNGVGFSGATVIRFITSSGANDATITVSNIVVSPDGTSLTATVNVSGTSAIGSRIVFISTPGGDSVTVDLGINKINVQ